MISRGYRLACEASFGAAMRRARQEAVLNAASATGMLLHAADGNARLALAAAADYAVAYPWFLTVANTLRSLIVEEATIDMPETLPATPVAIPAEG